MKKSQAGSTHVIIIVVLSIVLIGALGFLFWQNFISKSPPTEKVSSYAQCVKSDGSVIQESYPETCVTKSGDRFTNPDQKVTALPTKNYCTPSEKLCFDYPSDWAVKATQFDPQQEGKSEEVAISDQTGKKWLNLQAGLTGVGGTCGEEPGSLTKILKTYTTKVQGSYLVSEASKEYVQSTAYAVSFISFNGEKWSQTFELNNSKTVTKPGTIGMCDTGLAVINGKNADSGLGDGKHGAFSFTNHFSDDTYDTEATATAASETPEATKAYEILRSVHYE